MSLFNKNIARIALISLAALACIVTLPLQQAKSGAIPTPPHRPKSVPKAAVWIGGPDGGNFYDCILKADIHCTIYGDFAGEVVYAGRVALEPWQRQKYANIKDFYQDIDGFDGHKIFFNFRTGAGLN